VRALRRASALPHASPRHPAGSVGLHRRRQTEPVGANRGRVWLWAGVIAAELLVIAILAGSYWSVTGPTGNQSIAVLPSSDPGGGAQAPATISEPGLAPPTSTYNTGWGVTAPSTTVPSVVPLAGQVSPQPRAAHLPTDVADLFARLPNDWKKKVFESAFGSIQDFAIEGEQVAGFRLESSVATRAGSKCRAATFTMAIVGRRASGRVIACADERGEWTITSLERLTNR
jgi:hypothetical protein